jgi:hypothetical protein
MIEAAESFALAALEASDLVEEALVAHEKGDPGTNELVDRAEQAINAREKHAGSAEVHVSGNEGAITRAG